MQSCRSSTELTDTIPIKIAKKGPGAAEPITIPQLFANVVRAHGSRPALVCLDGDDKWQLTTYSDYMRLCRIAAKSFVKLGVRPGTSVSIIGFNAPEWYIADIGAILAGGVATGVYTTSSAHTCQYIFNDNSSVVLVVENSRQLTKVLEVVEFCPTVKAIVQYKGEIAPEQERQYVMTWRDFLATGKDVSDEELDKRISAQTPSNVCTLVYTSGTTGTPKGCMITHDNLTWTVDTFAASCQYLSANCFVSYLPLSHVATIVADLFLPMISGGVVYFAEPDAMRGSLHNTIVDCRPTIFVGVPRVWEKIEASLRMKLDAVGGVKGWVSRWARGVGLAGGYAKQQGRAVPYGWWFANKALFERVKCTLGIDQCSALFTCAAPISKGTLEFFLSVGIPIYEVYGLSESTGPAALTERDAHRLGSCGQKLPGTEIKIQNPDAHGQGEILLRGRHVFLGYLNNEQQTKATIDEEGWMHSGDLGRLDKDGYLFVTGRKKDLLILASGDNVAPTAIEADMKELTPLLSNVVVLGDKRKYLVMLVTLRVKFLEGGLPSNQLADEAQHVLQLINSTATTVEEAMSCENVQRHIDSCRTQANKTAATNAQKVRKYAILPLDFSVATGEITETLKLKRRVIEILHQDTIEKLYAGDI